MLDRMEFLKQAENRRSFFQRVERYFPSLDHRYVAIEKAYNDAKDAFRGKFREGGDRYFEHLRAVTLILMEYLRVKDYHLIIAALLHDIAEDIPSWDIRRIRAEYDDDVALLVSWLTKPPVSEFSDKKARDTFYHERFAFAPREFFLIKLADRLHNVLTLWDCSPSKQESKIEETRRYYLPYAERELILYHELVRALHMLDTRGGDV